MSIRRFLSPVNGSTLSIWCRVSSRFNVREIAWRCGWYWFTCASALGQVCVPGIHVNSIPAGHLTVTCSSIPVKRLPMPTNSYTQRVCWPRPKACCVSCPMQPPVGSPGEDFSLAPPQRVARSGGRAFSSPRQLFQRGCTGNIPSLVKHLAELILGFPGICGHGFMRGQHVGLWGLEVRPPSAPRPHFNQDSGTIPAIASFVTPHVSRISRKLPPS